MTVDAKRHIEMLRRKIIQALALDLIYFVADDRVKAHDVEQAILDQAAKIIVDCNAAEVRLALHDLSKVKT